MILCYSQKKNASTFLNPWKKLRHLPKIIDFDVNGNMVSKVVSKNDFINVKTVLKPAKKQRTPNSNDNQLMNHNIFDAIQTAIGKRLMQKPNKSKILVNCVDNFCRLLSCPDISKFCVLCLIPQHTFFENRNITSCQKVSTDHLIYQRSVTSLMLRIKQIQHNTTQNKIRATTTLKNKLKKWFNLI